MSQEIRFDGRTRFQLRPVHFTTGFIEYPEGSVLIAMGKTRVLCNASIQNSVPEWMTGHGNGWITAEYAMLPRATLTRTKRESNGPGARSQEIKRLIGRSLRAGVDLDLLGEKTIIIDCDVLQADGGTRTASITGGYLALALALKKLIDSGDIPAAVLLPPVAAVSIGILDNKVLVDLDYHEDSKAEVDMNVVMTASGDFIEVQGTAEGKPYSRQQLGELLDAAASAIQQLVNFQLQAID